MNLISSFFGVNSKDFVYKIIFVLMPIVCVHLTILPNNTSETYLSQTKFNDVSNTPEKIFLHFDKSHYTSGEHIWFKVYLVNAKSNRPDALSRVVHVDLINPSNEIINSRTIKIIDGGGAGEFYLPLKFVSGEYTVRAYTNFMRNFDHSFFFRKKIQIRSLNETLVISDSILINNNTQANEEITTIVLKPDVQFFPEGGYMVNEIASNVGIKVLDPYGKSIDISGVVLDDKGEEIMPFSTTKFGLGRFGFTPRHGKSYKAIIHYQGIDYTYDLPESLKKGVNMEVTLREDNYHISLQSSLANGIDGITLLGHQKGEIVCMAKLNGVKMKGIIIVPKSNLKQGIVQFIVFDDVKKPLCERLVFVETGETKSNISLKPSKYEFNERELVDVDISLETSLMELTEANTSVTVTDVSVVQHDPYGSDIRSHLLLNSELRGEIEEPGYYFYSKDPNKEMVLDLLMMTQGWRQFLWNDSGNENNKKVKYYPETGIRITGTVKDYYNHKKIASPELSLTFHNIEEYGHDEATTFENGGFTFGDYHFKDSTYIIIQAKKIKINKKTNQIKNKNPRMGYYIELDSFDSPKVTINKYALEYLDKSFSNDYVQRSKTIYHFDSINPYTGDYIKLDEVKLVPVKAKKKKNYDDRTFMYNDPSHRTDFDDVIMIYSVNPLKSLAGTVPGFTVNGVNVNLGRGNSSLLGNNEPLYLLNSMPVGKEVITGLSFFDVSWIDILKGYKASIWGSRAANGVVAVYTKNGKERAQAIMNKESKGIINFIHPGYYNARRFYEPMYKTVKPENDYPDYRSTIYWNPILKLDNSGKAKISFYTADITTTYRVELQGISSDGRIIKNEVYIDVK